MKLRRFSLHSLTSRTTRLLRLLFLQIPAPVWWAARWTAAVLVVLLAGFVLVMRYSVLPQVEQYRPGLEALVSQSLKLPVRIERVAADWHGLRPQLLLTGVQLLDGEGRSALRLERVQAEVGWLSLPTLSLRLHRLQIDAPALSIRRERDGHLYAAGIRVDQGGGGGDVSEWVLRQSSIVIRGAVIEWSDALRGAPTLALRNVNFRLDNSGSRHRFGLQAEPPPQLASRVDLRGDLKGRDLTQLATWKGSLYAELDYADLAGWRAWVDYPVWLPHGRGSLRLWTRLANRQIENVTADLALRDVTVRLLESLPVMELSHLAGRLQVRLPEQGKDKSRFELSAKRLNLTTRDGLNVPAMDFASRWTPPAAGQPGRGEFSASALDFITLSTLSRFVPLDTHSREALARYAPRGRMADVHLTWTGNSDKLDTYSVRARFEALGIEPVGVAPGFEGVSGAIEATERGGSVTLDSTRAAVSLPAVFPEPRLALDDLKARLQWAVHDGLIDASLQSLTLANADAAGMVSGRWRGRAGELGELDLTAQLSRANPQAVWRYLPKVVGQASRDWVRDAIRGGECAETNLQLRGPIKLFPFEDDRGGLFRVSAKCKGVTLDYKAGWPKLEGADAQILFQGKRMEVRAQGGAMLNARVTEARAEIPDLMHHDEILGLRGKVAGPSAEFLKFLRVSPLAERFGATAEALNATGNGALELDLTLPIRRVADTRVQGSYQFSGNRIVLGDNLPTLNDAGARLAFTQQGLTIPAASATVFGTPFTFTAQTRADGTFVGNASGRLVVADMRRVSDAPVLGYLFGAAPWQVSISARTDSLTVQAESSLQGLTSSLPSPFNKTTADAQPLRLEYTLSAPSAQAPRRSQFRATMGRAFNVQLVRKTDAGQTTLERGVIAVGEPAPLPERGVLLAATLKSFDYSAWRRAFLQGADKADQAGVALPVTAVSLKAGVATLGGQLFNDVQLTGTLNDNLWQTRVVSREATGDISYRSTGKGRVVARFKQLALSDLREDDSLSIGPASTSEAPTELPGLDILADQFSLKGHALGRLELLAVNRGPVWRMEKIAITHPDGSFTGDGQWRATPASAKTTEPATQVNLKIESGNVGRLLERVGYPEAVRRGSGRLDAKLAWAGPPTTIDYPSLAGEIRLDVANGQFTKLEPGVGRLLGVVSLQSLPRRITLDFRDVFSEGFAFDSISGSMKVSRGVMSSDDLQIRGPAARVMMKGEVDLAAETQNLRVKVQPTLSESVAIGAAMANPVVGVATYLAQKVLRDPFEKLFAFEYRITGDWVEPKVQKLAADETPDNPNKK